MVGEKIKDKVQGVANKYQGPLSNVRSSPIDKIKKSQDVLNGRGIGVVAAAIATILDDAVGVPFGASSDTVSAEPVSNGMRYIVDVNAPFDEMANARASIDTGTGFTSFVIDDIEVKNIRKVRTRPLRDTYRVTLVVRD